MKISLDKEELYTIIKEAVKDALQEEKLEFFLKAIPPVSEEEMEDIKKLYGKPTSDKKPAFSETIET